MQGFSREEIAQYEDVRRQGVCNMLDRSCVKRLARARGHMALVCLIEAGRYGELLSAYDRDAASTAHDDFDFTGGGI